MTQPAHDPNACQALRARNVLIQTIKANLKSSGLDIRERASELVISHPGHPENGRIHITYTNGDVSYRRTIWDYLGPLQGYEPNDDPDREPGVTAETIITALTETQPPGKMP